MVCQHLIFQLINFFKCAWLFYGLNDFPAYGNQSGWSTKGYLACPICNKDTVSTCLRSKICYVDHCRFFHIGHPLRCSCLHNNKHELRSAPTECTGEEVLLQLQSVENVILEKSRRNEDKKRKRTPAELN